MNRFKCGTQNPKEIWRKQLFFCPPHLIAGIGFIFLSNDKFLLWLSYEFKNIKILSTLYKQEASYHIYTSQWEMYKLTSVYQNS